jgi:transposase
MSHWANAPLDRCQASVFAPTLDDSIAADHPVRLFDEVLRGTDFRAWESMYVRVVGQPPIHPRVMAAGLLYGMSLGIRSSRKLEDACSARVDFMWLMDGRCPDHATFSKFRTQFDPQLKDLFRQIGRVGIEVGLVTLNQVTLDGTVVNANNSRYQTNRRATLEQKLAALDQQIEQAMAQTQQQDEAEDRLFGREVSPVKLPAELRNLKHRQERLRKAMSKLQEMDKQRAGRKDVSDKGPAVPLTDPEARVLKGKAGGFAPAYTPVLAMDSDSGMIVDTQVLAGNDETSTVLPAMQNIQENFGKLPQQVAADSGFNSGPNLADLKEQGVEALMPAKRQFAQNPAVRSDPTQPVPVEQHQALPIDPQNKILDKSTFTYDAAHDCYHCPMGRPLDYVEDKPYCRGQNKGTYRVFESASCEGCPLAGQCLPKKVTARRVCRDEYEEDRQEMAARMASPPGKEQYRRRSHAAETPFAVFKSVMGLRQFLLRGLDKVGMEFRWTAIAYNLMKLVRFFQSTRAASATVTAG